MKNTVYIILLAFAVLFTLNSCSDDNTGSEPKDPETAERVEVDRFSDIHGTLMRRSLDASLPAANSPVNFDQAPFITQSLGADGQVIRYYNFDVQPLPAAPLYMLVKGDDNTPVADQLNIIGVIPGDAGYNDFWQIYFVHVSDDYVANTVTNIDDLFDLGSISKQNMIVNCPVVPEGSIADARIDGSSTSLIASWYKDKIAYYFSFEEKILEEDDNGLTPTSPIYVCFNINPDASNPESGTASGVKFEDDGIQSHNVIETIPSDSDYSALWSVYVYDNADFDNVYNLETAKAANILAEQAMYVNCPVVYTE